LAETFHEIAFPGQGELIETEDGYLLRKITDDCYVYDMDMILTREQADELDDIINSSYFSDQPTTRGTIVTQSKYNWIGKTISYTFNSNLTATHKERINAAIEVWRTQTQMKFEYFTPGVRKKDFVEFKAGNGNSSQVGRVGGRQEIIIDKQYGTTGNMIHEIGHAVGLIHEHQNFMRDDYIIVHENNIQADYRKQFEKKSGNQHVHIYTVFDRCFPFSSIMMYPSRNNFGITPTTLTMTAKNVIYSNMFVNAADNSFISQREYLTASDRGAVAWKYGYPYDPATDPTLTDEMKGISPL
jgi:hypothetical protein